MPLPGQDDIGVLQDFGQLVAGDDPLLFGCEATAAAGKIAAVVHQADKVGVHIVNRPIQAGQLAEIGIFG